MCEPFHTHTLTHKKWAANICKARFGIMCRDQKQSLIQSQDTGAHATARRVSHCTK